MSSEGIGRDTNPFLFLGGVELDLDKIELRFF